MWRTSSKIARTCRPSPTRTTTCSGSSSSFEGSFYAGQGTPANVDLLEADVHRDAPVAAHLHALARDVAVAEALELVGGPQVGGYADVAAAANRVLRDAVAGRERADMDLRVMLVRFGEHRHAGGFEVDRELGQRRQVRLERGKFLGARHLAGDPHGTDVDA